MYIRNKSGLIQECHNEDVIRACQKDAEHFTVVECKEKLSEKEMVSPSEKTELEKMKADELKALAKEKGIGGASSLTRDELLVILKDVM